jgi:hypothetical protein
MKRAIFTVCVDDYFPELCKLTLPTIEAYARRIGADFHLIRERRNQGFPPTYEKTQIHDLGRGYDVCILIDADIAVSRRLPDISQLSGPRSVGVWMTFPAQKLFGGDPLFSENPGQRAISSQILVVPKACHELWKPLDMSPEEAARRCNRFFIVDEYCFSRNMALHGFRHSGVIGNQHLICHMNVGTDPASDPVAQARDFISRDSLVRERRAVATLCIGEYFEKMAEITHPRIARYARKIGADFHVIRDQGRWTSPAFRKLDLLELLSDYDRVLYIDTDILVREETPDLFELVPPEQLGVFEEGKYKPQDIAEFQKFLQNLRFPEGIWNGKLYNTGVMVLSQAHRALFAPPPEECYFYFEQGYLNANIAWLGVETFELDQRYNRMSLMDWVTGESRLQSYMIHYAGGAVALKNEGLLALMKNDEMALSHTPLQPRPTRNIALLVTGQSSSPEQDRSRVLRELQQLCNDEMVIVSQTPERFEGLGVQSIAPGSGFPFEGGCLFRQIDLDSPQPWN